MGNTPVMLAEDFHAFHPVGNHGQQASLDTVKTLTIPDGATKLMCQARAKDIRFTLDGATDPTASKGFFLPADGDWHVLPVGNDTEFRFIETAASATLEYQFGF